MALFDGMMRTCRERLNRHAARRRKAHARSTAGDYGTGSETYLPPVYGGPAGGGAPPGGPAGVLHAAQAVLQRVVVQREVEAARAMPHWHDPQLRFLAGPAAAPPVPPRPAPGGLLTPLLEPRPMWFHPPMFPSRTQGHLVDPVAARARVESVLASATAALAARHADQVAPQPLQNMTVEDTYGREAEAGANHIQALKDALEWLVQGGGGGDGGGGQAPGGGGGGGARNGPPLHAPDLHSALGAALAGLLRQAGGPAGGQRPGEGGGL